MAKAVYKIWSL